MATSQFPRGKTAGTADESLSSPPILAGYTYRPDEAYEARDDGRLLAIRLETNRSCNLSCRYCYARSGAELGDENDFETLCDVIRQAADLGVKSVVVIGGGEPTLHPRFRDLITFIHSLDIRPMVFTNCLKVTEDLAQFLWERNASVMGKLDSLEPDVQDFLAGQEGAYDRIHRGLDNLLEAGFGEPEDPGELRLGASFVSCRMNLDEIEDIWHFCRQRNIFPNMEVLTPTGRAKETLPDQGLETDEIMDYKLKMLDIDREHYGYDWLPYTPLAGSGCLQHLYSLYVTIEGHVRPCAPTKFDQHPELKEDGVYPHNIRGTDLREVYESDLFRYVRHVEKYLEGRCDGCEHLDQCIGCRGYAYSVGVEQGKSPREALRMGCLQCNREREL
ncbi:MAG: radical SAM protein [Planctomycetota bacterium]